MSLDAMLNQTVHIAARTALGKGGNAPTYAAPISYPARVERKAKMIRGKDGNDRAASIRVYLAGDVPVDQSDQLTFDGAAYEILEIEQQPGRYGAMELKVVFA
jgi:hypothetical protein